MTDTMKESAEQPSLVSTAPNELPEALKDAASTGGTPSPLPRSGAPVQPHSLLPHRGLYYAVLTGGLAGLFTALLTIILVLIFATTFHAARQQIALDRLTVKTALALAGVELLTGILGLLVGFVVGIIVGKIAVRRRLGFLAGALAGAVFSLLIFLVSLIPSYPGNLGGNGAMTTGSLVFAFLLLCLGSLGGGLISLLGTWIATVKHPHYLKLEG